MDIPVAKTGRRLGQPTLVVLAAVLLIGLAGFGVFGFTSALPSVPETELWISQVKAGPLTREVRGVGVLAPSEVRWLAAQSMGRVERLVVKPGAEVNPDTVIAELSNPELHRQIQQAKWELDAAQAKLLALTAELQEQALEQKLLVTQAEMALAEAEMLERAQRPLASKNIISELDYQTTQLKAEQSKVLLTIRRATQERRAEVNSARLAAERAQVKKYQNLVNNYQAQINELVITAGVQGVLQEVSVDVGQQVQIGSNIARVARPDSLLAELQVQENLAQDVQLGLPVVIDTRNGLVNGKVVRVDPRVLDGNVQVDVVLVDELPAGARPDLSITGTITVENISDTLFIDRPAGVVADSQVELYRIDQAGNIAQITTVQLGKASVSQIEVLNGLAQGDAVVVSDTSDYAMHNAFQISQ